MQKARSHPRTGPKTRTKAPTACRHTVSGSLSLASRRSFHLSLTVLVHYRSRASIQPWRVVPPASTRAPRCPRPTRVPVPLCRHGFTYRALTSCGGPFQVASAPHDVTAGETPALAPQPRRVETPRFGLLPFRSPLLRESRLISFPPGTEMFQFPGLALPLGSDGS
jgi:hypothetical protein